MNLIKFFKVTVLVLILTSCAHSSSSASSEYSGHINQQQLLALQQTDEQFLLLDVRTEEEYLDAHIPGAVNISHKQLSEKLKDISQYKNNNIIVYCRSGRRAGMAIDILQENGFTKVSHLDGDMNGWQEKNLPITSNP